MTDDRRRPLGPIDLALDLWVFAPLGFLTSVREVVPDLAARGRKVADEQLNNARAIGRFALRRGPGGASGGSPRSLDRASARPAPLRASARPSQPPIETVAVEEGLVEEHIPVRLEDVVDEGLDTVTWESVGEDELAIPSYDSLAASQVVARLAGLSADELEAVRRYEVAHRGRKTVLGKVAQLQRP